MQLIKTILNILAFIWTLPVNLPAWLFWFLPMYLNGSFSKVYIDWEKLNIIWDVNNKSNFYKESMVGWYGFVIGINIVCVDLPYNIEDMAKHLNHEKVHVEQNKIFGILFYPIYVLMTCFIWLFIKNKHAYIDNPFERWARREAGEKVNIPQNEWTNGPNDRWPWW